MLPIPIGTLGIPRKQRRRNHDIKPRSINNNNLSVPGFLTWKLTAKLTQQLKVEIDRDRELAKTAIIDPSYHIDLS
jgi:hypothetical protein